MCYDPIYLFFFFLSVRESTCFEHGFGLIHPFDSRPTFLFNSSGVVALYILMVSRRV